MMAARARLGPLSWEPFTLSHVRGMLFNPSLPPAWVAFRCRPSVPVSRSPRVHLRVSVALSLTAALLLQNLSIYHVKPYLLLWSCRISVPSPHAYMKHIRTVCLCMTVRPRPVCFVFPTSTIYLPAFTLLRAASRCFAPPFDLGAYFLAHAVDRLYYSYSAT